MAIKGLAKPYVAKYACTDGTVAYTSCTKIGSARKTEIKFSSESTPLYGDDAIVETANEITGIDLTLELTDLDATTEALLMGLTAGSETINTESVKTLTYNGHVEPPYLGFGIVVKSVRDHAGKFYALILKRVQFSAPDQSAETKEKATKWQTPKLSAKAYQDESASGDYYIKAECDSEATAEAYIKKILGATV